MPENYEELARRCEEDVRDARECLDEGKEATALYFVVAALERIAAQLRARAEHHRSDG